MAGTDMLTTISLKEWLRLREDLKREWNRKVALVNALQALMHEYVPADDSEPDPKTRAVIKQCHAALSQAQ